MKASIQKISIPVILEKEYHLLERLGDVIYRAGFKNIVMFLGEGIKAMFGATINKSIEEGSKGLSILRTFEFYNNEIHALMDVAFTLPKNTDVVIGIGGGRVLDVAKYSSFLNGLPFISVPTSMSNDGFSSSGCSLVINGRRTSVIAAMPYGIIVDLGVIQNSPKKFIFSGIGDLVSKITAIHDLGFEQKNCNAVLDDFAIMIAKKSVNSIVRMEFDSITDEFFIKELVDSLTMSGIAMEIAGNSSPASGSEHLISHALDSILEVPQLHGVQVGVATYLMSKVQDHRYERVTKFLNQTGFFEFVSTLGMKKEHFIKAIDLAPSIKPSRHTYIHYEQFRNEAKRLVYEDDILRDILI